MRISDWSSDVCSSDLIPVEQRLQGSTPDGILAAGALPSRRQCACYRSLTALWESPARLWRLITGKPAYDDRRTAAQPGAASPDRALWLRRIGAPRLVLPDPRRPPRSRRLYRAARWNAGGQVGSASRRERGGLDRESLGVGGTIKTK